MPLYFFGMSLDEAQKKIERLEALLNSAQRAESQSRREINYLHHRHKEFIKELNALYGNARSEQLSRIICKYKENDQKENCYW